MALIVILVALNGIALNSCTVAIVSAINNELSAHPKRKGVLMGVVVTLEAAGKAMGPALGAPAYAWAATSDGVGPLRGSAAAFTLFACAMLSLSLIAVIALPHRRPTKPEACPSQSENEAQAAAAGSGAEIQKAAALENQPRGPQRSRGAAT